MWILRHLNRNFSMFLNTTIVSWVKNIIHVSVNL